MPGFRSVMCRKPHPMRIRAPPCDMTVHGPAWPACHLHRRHLRRRGSPIDPTGSMAAGRGHAPRTPVHSMTAGSDREPPNLHPSVTASVGGVGFAVTVSWSGACLSLLPVPDSCRERNHPGGGGREAPGADVVQRFRLVAFLCGWPAVAAGGGGQEQPALPRSAGRGCCPGDMMIDWVSPPGGDAAAHSNQAVRLAPCRPGRRRLTAVRREPAAVVPIGEFGCGVPCAGPVRHGKWSP